jgi:hypothetical protein
MDQENKNKVAAAIREELHRLTAEGPFTIARAMKVKRIAQASVLVLRSLSDSVADKAPDPKLPLFEALADTSESFMGDQESLGPIAPAPAAETHATTIMREVIAAVPRFLAMQHSNPFELVRAVAHAEACGMSGLATKLRSQLGIEKPEESTPPKPDFIGLLSYPKTRAEGETPLHEPMLASDSEKGTASPSAVLEDCCDPFPRESDLFKKTDVSPWSEEARRKFEADPRIPESLKLRPIT